MTRLTDHHSIIATLSSSLKDALRLGNLAFELDDEADKHERSKLHAEMTRIYESGRAAIDMAELFEAGK